MKRIIFKEEDLSQLPLPEAGYKTIGMSTTGLSVLSSDGGVLPVSLYESGTGTSSIQPLHSGTASADCSVIAGGFGNIITETSSFSSISGGQCNTVSNTYIGVISGGDCNTLIGGAFMSINGGRLNTNSGVYSTIGGGSSNMITSNYNTISGGRINTSSSYASTVGGGVCNISDGNIGAISGGMNNTILNDSTSNTISGGRNNTSSGAYVVVGGCFHNKITGGFDNNFGTISGGYCNAITGTSSFSSISGGRCNTIEESTISTISGGQYNFITGTSSFSGIVSGNCNVISGSSSFSGIMGGNANTINDNGCSFIIGSNIVADRSCTTFVNNLSIMNIATASAGLPTGAIWRDGENIKIVI